MIIQNTRQLDLASSYSKTVSHERSESLRLWKDGNSVEMASKQRDSISISAAAHFSLQQGLRESSQRSPSVLPTVARAEPAVIAAPLPALASTPAANKVASKVLFIVIVVTLPILKWITAVSRHPALSTSHQACAASPFALGIAPCSTGRIR